MCCGLSWFKLSSVSRSLLPSANLSMFIQALCKGALLTIACSNDAAPAAFECIIFHSQGLVWDRGTPLNPLPIYFLIFSPFYFSLSFIGFTYFLLLSSPPLSTRIVPLRFQAGGRRRRPNRGLVCVLLCNLCYLYSLVKMDCGVLFYWFSLVLCVPSVLWHCWLGHLTRTNPSPIWPIMCLVGR